MESIISKATGICRLCENAAKLERSHILPAAAHRVTKDNGRNVISYLRRGLFNSQNQKDFAEPLLCFACEQRLSIFEGAAIIACKAASTHRHDLTFKFMIILFSFLYLAILGFGIYLIRLSLQIHSGKRLPPIRGRNGKTLENSKLISKDFVVMSGFLGVAIVVFAIAILVFGIRLSNWKYILGLIVSVGGIWRQVILVRYDKLSEKIR